MANVTGAQSRKLNRQKFEDRVQNTLVAALTMVGGRVEDVTDDVLERALVEAKPKAERETLLRQAPERSGLSTDSVDTSPAVDTREKLLRDLKSNQKETQFRAVIVLLHLGERVFPRQPESLTRKSRSPLGGRTVPAAAKDLGLFHPAQGTTSCPTCRAIARFVRVPGLDARGVSLLIDSAAVREE